MIRDELKNIILSCRKSEMLKYINEHPEFIEDIITFALSDEQPIGWRAAYLLNQVVKSHKEKLSEFIPVILAETLEKTSGHQRELIKILSQFKLKDEETGKLFDLCIRIWENITNSPSERITALKFILMTTDEYSELKNEISHFFDLRYTEQLPRGAKHSVNLLEEKFNKSFR